MNYQVVGALISVAVIAVSAFVLGYGRGRDAGQDDVLELIRDDFPDAWERIEDNAYNVMRRHEDRYRDR